MDMLRSFLPVGQGAFYTEQFRNGVNVVYDCGSQTGVEHVEKMIESTFDKGEEIYAVFISHLHSDHMNGLAFLLKHCKVKNLYLPFLTPQDISISMLVQDLSKGGCTQFVREFICDNRKTLKKYCEENDVELPEVKYVLSKADADAWGPQIESHIKQYHFSGDPICAIKEAAEPRWVYIPYNLKNDERKKKLIDELMKIGVDASNIEDVKEKMSNKRGRSEIKRIYEALPGGVNTNSMTVYSGPDITGRDRAGQRLAPNPLWMWTCCDCHSSIQPGCLYMGDFDASEKSNFNSLDQNYSDYWNKIGVLQIPHHGSKHNFNANLLTKACFYVISAGAENKYKHPHAKVLKEIILSRQPFVWVTEKVNSTAQFVVYNI